MASRFLSFYHRIRRFLGLFVWLLALSTVAVPSANGETFQLAIKTDTARHEFSVEVMRTAEDRARGLMYRQQMKNNHGMLFDFGQNTTARMWMKNTYIPLDMLFIRADGSISNIAGNTVPHSTDVLSSKGEVRYVLEINGGLSDKLGIGAGDQVTLPGN